VPAAASELDTRTRLLDAATVLFRQRGYHGVGVSDVLAAAAAPKGSLYHHFPGGKDQLAIEAIDLVGSALLQMIDEHRSHGGTAALVRSVGARVHAWMNQTRGGSGGACAFLAAFAAEGDTAPVIRAAVKLAYERIAKALAERLVADGWPRRAAHDCGLQVIAMFEGGGLVSQTLGEPRVFSAVVEHAASLCRLPHVKETRT
jgi:TetR/AcrR family transcriptional repressor of lmrAB and yxaGH operons